MNKLVKLYSNANASNRTKNRVEDGDHYNISRECPIVQHGGTLIQARMICHIRTGWVGWVANHEIKIEEE